VNKNYLVLPLAIFFFAVSSFYPAGIGLKEGQKGSVCFAGTFIMEQDSGTSEGLLQRYIDISSPWTGAYIYEDFHAVGRVEVFETFTMENLRPGVRARDFDIFGVDSKENSGSAAGGTGDSAGQNNFGSGVKINPVSEVKEMVASVSVRIFPSWLDLF
jgi:hypothetical protein